MEEIEYHSPDLNKRAQEVSKKNLEGYKTQINEIFKDLYIDPENPESLIEIKRNLFSGAYKCLKSGSAIILLGFPIWSSNFDYVYNQIKLDQPIFSLENNYNLPNPLEVTFEWIISFIGIFFLILGLCNLYVSIGNGIECLKLGKKLKKAEKLKNELVKELKNNPRALNLEMKTYLNFLEYHTNEGKIEESEVAFIQVPLYLSTHLVPRLKTKSDLLIKNPKRIKKNKIKPIRGRWYAS